jgi:catechol 2,3-dioxygenase-like lactoylglutathione lyase family enzyme
MDFRLEVVQVPVSDVDRAKTFYTEKVGFHADHDTRLSDAVRVVQLTPPGSACSIVIGTGLSDMTPGSVEGLQLTVTDMDAARSELVDCGVDVSDVKVLGRPGGPGFKHAYFRDPDGNGRAVQEIPAQG